MPIFRCNASGQTFDFKEPADVKSMRCHPDYTEVTEDGVLVPKFEELLKFWHENRVKVNKPAKKDK